MPERCLPSIPASVENRRTQVTATASINELIERGMKSLRELDAYMRNTHAVSPAKTAAWRSASRIERRTPRVRPTEKQTAPPTSPKADTPAD